MSDPRPSEPFEAGRTDPAWLLTDRLARAEPDYLEGALENPVLDVELAMVLLRNPAASPALLGRAARDPRFRRSYEVRAGLVRHPGTPRGIAMNLVHHLFWRDLALAADDFRVPPPVRRVAVHVLESRLEEMALGERVTLGRTAGRSVLLALRNSSEERVVEALLENPRTVEDDAVFLAASRDTTPNILALLARCRKWIVRYRVRFALVNNGHTPVGVALGLITGLLRRDLEGIAARPDRPPVLRLAAARVLKARGPRRTPQAEVDGTYHLDEKE